MLTFLPEALENYVHHNATPEDSLFAELAEETRRETELPQMMVGNVEGMILRLLTRMTGARRVLEIGTFTGYSALSIAHGLPDDGTVITCDIDPEATSIARKYWERSEHGRKIDLRLAPALETIASLSDEFDMLFIDADKENYSNYWDAALPLVRQHGVVVADNVLWSGKVLEPDDADTKAIVAFNAKVKRDDRVEHVMLSIRDGMTIAVKR